MYTSHVQLGEAVHVNAHATWWPATVTSISRTLIGVEFPAELPLPLTGPVPAWVVRPAAGLRLCRVATLRPGDQVVDYTGTARRVEQRWRGGDGWWVIEYADGQRGLVPPNAVLRLCDPTAPAATAPDRG